MPEKLDEVMLNVEPEHLVFVHEASAETGIPVDVIRQWAHRGKIHTFPGDGRCLGNGHLYRVMYSLPEIESKVGAYKARKRSPRSSEPLATAA